MLYIIKFHKHEFVAQKDVESNESRQTNVLMDQGGGQETALIN